MIFPCPSCGEPMRAGETCERCEEQRSVLAAKAPAKRRTQTIFDPARAAYVTERFEGGVWRQVYHCPAGSSADMHELTCDPDGGRAICSCKGYQYSRDRVANCLHTRAARAIIRVAASDAFAALDADALTALDRTLTRRYGQGGLAGNIRYACLGDALIAARRREDVPATIARGKAAVADLFDEAG